MNRANLVWRVAPVIILATGFVIAGIFVITGPAPSATPSPPPDRLVRTFRASPSTHRIGIKAFGTSRAAQQWTPIAEVAGRVTSLHDGFAEGDVVQAGTLLATIEKLDYEIAVKTAKTEVASQEQKQLELLQTKTNLEATAESRKQQVTIAKAELDRMQQMLDRGAGSQAEYDRAVSTHLDSETALRNLTNELNLIPIQQQSLDLSLEAAKLHLQQAERNVERCQIRLPFTALCVTRDCELHQLASEGQQLGKFITVDRAEIFALVEARRALGLVPKLRDTFGAIDLTSQDTSLINELRQQFDSLNFPVDVSWRAGENESQWRGRIQRVSATVDESTRSIPFIIEVKDAFTAVQLGVRPALVPGMFLELLIYGDQLENVYVIPRDVIRENSVYVVRDGKLAIVAVNVMVLEEQSAVVDSGLREGDQVILADLFPAANGMPLRYEEVPNPVKPRLDLPSIRSAAVDLTE